MTFIVDIDDHLLLYDKNKKFDNIIDKYKSAKPNKDEIHCLNTAYTFGHTIILHTGRNWDKYEFTKQQMKEFRISYHELIMGKPQGIYVDKDSIKSLKEIHYEHD